MTIHTVTKRPEPSATLQKSPPLNEKTFMFLLVISVLICKYLLNIPVVYNSLATNIPNNVGLFYLKCGSKGSLDETWKNTQCSVPKFLLILLKIHLCSLGTRKQQEHQTPSLKYPEHKAFQIVYYIAWFHVIVKWESALGNI